MKSIGFLEELQREVVARHKTETRRLTIIYSILAAISSFQMVVARTFWPVITSFVPGTRSAKLSISKNHISTTWTPTGYFTSTIRQTSKPCKTSDMENTSTNPDSGGISNPCRQDWPVTSFG